MMVGTVVTDFTHNTLNQLTAMDETDDGYDANGNLTSKVQSGTTTSYGGMRSTD